MQFGQLKRREFITLLGGAAVPWPFAARAQQPGMPVLGILNATSPETAFYLAGLRKGLREAGYVEGLNIEIETRWAEGQYDRLPALAAELVRRPVTVIAAGGIPPLMAAKAATSTIPIVFTSAGDPVQLGLVASLNRPRGNVTGVSHFGVTLAPKRLELLLKLVPNATVIAVLENPSNPRIDLEATELEAAAHATGKRLLVVKASNETEFETAFTTLLQPELVGCLLPASRFSSFGASNWSHWRRATRSQQSTTIGISPRPVGYSVTGSI
jgi:putative tryptophan/tyrosine transport system substrate-binding protein